MTVLESHKMPNSLVYGADWSWLYCSLEPVPSVSLPASDVGNHVCGLKVAGEPLVPSQADNRVRMARVVPEMTAG